MATKKTGKEVTNIQAELKKELAGLKDRVDPPSGFMVGVKGKVFTMPDGSSNPGPLTCVIVDWVTSNSYFEGVYNPKDVQPPVCWAIADNPADAKPSPNAPKPQHATCKGCPMDEWGSAGQGRAGKACKNTRRLLIVPVNATEKTPGWVVPVSPTALKHFDRYVTTLSDTGTHPIEVITDISFDPSEAYPSLRFEAVDKHDNLDVIWALRSVHRKLLLQEPKVEEKN